MNPLWCKTQKQVLKQIHYECRRNVWRLEVRSNSQDFTQGKDPLLYTRKHVWMKSQKAWNTCLYYRFIVLILLSCEIMCSMVYISMFTKEHFIEIWSAHIRWSVEEYYFILSLRLTAFLLSSLSVWSLMDRVVLKSLIIVFMFYLLVYQALPYKFW